jgi:zinc/manganese transport system ATP-binding protein
MGPEAHLHQPASRVVSLSRVHVSLGGKSIQEDMTFTIEGGELVAVLGPNGAGKSTLLKVLLGLIRPASGRVEVLGRPPGKGNARIGYVPQFRDTGAEQPLRGREVVRFGLDGNRWGPGWPSRTRGALVDAVLEEVDARDLAERPIGELSGGERQRLFIAQALLTDPRLILLDEPLANLDITREQELVSLVARVCRSRGIAVLFVTHDINPLLGEVDRVLYMANGHCAIGTPEEVITGAALSALYGSPVEVVKALGRIFVVGAQT